MDSRILNWLYTTNTAIQDIINYVDALSLQDPGNQIPHVRDSRTNAITQIIWPPGVSNPVPYDYDPILATSGFIEDLTQLKSQLGYENDPLTGVLISGSIWNTDYEYHLEYGTHAMLQPVVSLANNIIKPALEGITVELLKLHQATTEPKKIQVVVQAGYQADEVILNMLDGFDGLVDHWPDLTFMRSLEAEGSTYYQVENDKLKDLIRIIPTISDGVAGPPFRITEAVTSLGRYSAANGIILVR